MATLKEREIDANTAPVEVEVNAAEAGTTTARLTPKGRETRQKLLVAAREAFEEYGYAKTRVADITHMAKVSHGNFYRHFKDKDHVLMTLLEGLHADMRSDTARARGAGRVPTLEDMVTRNTAFFMAYAEDRGLYLVAREAAAQGRDSSFLSLWKAMREVFIKRTQRWLEGLRQDQVLGATCDVELLAEALGSLTEQMAYVHVALAPAMPRREQLEELGRVCAHIWYHSVFAGQTSAGTQETGEQA